MSGTGTPSSMPGGTGGAGGHGGTGGAGAHSTAGTHPRRQDDAQEWTTPRLVQRLLHVARPVLPPLAVSVLCRTLALCLGIALFALGGWAVCSWAEAAGLAADVAGRGSADPGAAAPTWSLTRIAWTMVALALAKGVLRYLEQFSGHWVAFRSLALLRMYFYDHLEPQAPARTEGADSGDLLSRVTKDVDRIEVFFAHTLAPALTAVLVPTGVLVYLGVATSWWVALVLAPFLLLVGAVVPRIGARHTEVAARVIREGRGRLSQHVTDSVQGVREVLAFGAQSRRSRRMADIESRIGTAQDTSARVIALRRGLGQALVALALVAVTAVVGALAAGGELTLAQVGLALGVTLGVFAPVTAVEDFQADLDQAFASARRVFEVTERAPLVADPDHPRDTDGSGAVTLRGVSFGYPRVGGAAPDDGGAVVLQALRRRVLHDVTLDFPAGAMTAVVGASGSGKSTLAALVERMWDVDAGAVCIGGIDIRDLTQRRLRELVAHAPQRPYVFNDTVRANLLLARPGADRAALERVCEQVGLSQWLAEEPDGLDTQVGEMGERLSGGQRQRLALARALLRGAPVTILDEATSQLDRDTEAHVLAGIREATRGRTLIVIAHRVSTVRDADRIVVIDAGHVVEVGTYSELIARDGALAGLVGREAQQPFISGPLCSGVEVRSVRTL
ncbi:MAG: thiol reductant ABC exporter subunit CydC [Pauljensenia sp.]